MLQLDVKKYSLFLKKNFRSDLVDIIHKYTYIYIKLFFYFLLKKRHHSAKRCKY